MSIKALTVPNSEGFDTQKKKKPSITADFPDLIAFSALRLESGDFPCSALVAALIRFLHLGGRGSRKFGTDFPDLGGAKTGAWGGGRVGEDGWRILGGWGMARVVGLMVWKGFCSGCEGVGERCDMVEGSSMTCSSVCVN